MSGETACCPEILIYDKVVVVESQRDFLIFPGLSRITCKYYSLYYDVFERILVLVTREKGKEEIHEDKNNDATRRNTSAVNVKSSEINKEI